MPIELVCLEMKRLTNDYYKCDNPEMRDLIYDDIKLLSKALFLSDQSDMGECKSILP